MQQDRWLWKEGHDGKVAVYLGQVQEPNAAALLSQRAAWQRPSLVPCT